MYTHGHMDTKDRNHHRLLVIIIMVHNIINYRFPTRTKPL